MLMGPARAFRAPHLPRLLHGQRAAWNPRDAHPKMHDPPLVDADPEVPLMVWLAERALKTLPTTQQQRR